MKLIQFVAANAALVVIAALGLIAPLTLQAATSIHAQPEVRQEEVITIGPPVQPHCTIAAGNCRPSTNRH